MLLGTDNKGGTAWHVATYFAKLEIIQKDLRRAGNVTKNQVINNKLPCIDSKERRSGTWLQRSLIYSLLSNCGF